VVKRPPGQQEEQKRHRRIEIGMRTMGDRLVQGDCIGQDHAKRDRHVHVGAAMPERTPGRDKEDPARIDASAGAAISAEIQ
jgi:hypothetical protein